MCFIELYSQRLTDDNVDLSLYTGTLIKEAESLSSIFEIQLRQVLGADFSLKYMVTPVFILLMQQCASVGSLKGYSSISNPSNVAPHSNLSDLAKISIGDEQFSIFQDLMCSDDPFDLAAHYLEKLKDIVGSKSSEELDQCPLGALVSSSSCSSNRILVSLGFSGIERLYLKLNQPSLIFFRGKASPKVLLNPNVRLNILSLINLTVPDLSVTEKKILACSILFFPTSYLEAFSGLLKHCVGIAYKTNTLLMGAEFIRRPEVAILATLIKNRGGRVIGSQHGAFYGQTDPGWQELSENWLSDTYLTWGYRYQNTHKPMPSIRLSHVQRKTKNVEANLRSKKIMLVAPYFTDEIAFGFHSPSLLSQHAAFSKTLDFLDLLLKNGYQIQLRFHPRNNIDQLKNQFKKLEHPGFNLSQGKRGLLAADAMQFEQVIFSTPNATGLSECAACKLPFLILADPTDFWIQEPARTLYTWLQQENIWISRQIEPADLICAYKSHNQQMAFKSFERQFALTSNDYLKVWSLSLKEVARNQDP
jgi:hypothetical protein